MHQRERTRSGQWRAGVRNHKPKYFWGKKKKRRLGWVC